MLQHPRENSFYELTVLNILLLTTQTTSLSPSPSFSYSHAKNSQETPQESEQRRLHHRAKLAVRDPVIAEQDS
jgi:hypothetical protein